MEPLSWASYLRTPNEHHPRLSFHVDGAGTSGVRAARVIIDHAVDDTGKELRNQAPPKFYHLAVGSTSPAEFLGPNPPKIEDILTEVAANATTIKELRGRIQLVIPALHPDATVVIDRLPARLGSRIDAAALLRAHITLAVFGPGQSAAAAEAAKIKNVSFAEQYLSAAQLARMPPLQREQMLKRPVPEIGEHELLLVVADPEDRLVGVEFAATDGSPVVYNRNGFSHLESQGWRLSTYRLDRPASADLRLICWLAIDPAIAEIPFRMNDVPLPPWPAASVRQPTPAHNKPDSP